MIRKIKNFIHRYEALEKMVFFAWGIFFIIRAKLIFRKIKHDAPKTGSPKVLILALRSIPTTNLVYFDAIFGHAFKKLGCDVKMLYCGGFLNSCDADTVFRSQRPQCFVCKNLGSQIRNSLSIDPIFYSQYISNSDVEEIKRNVASLDDENLSDYKYLGVNVGEHALASAIRHFLFGKLNLNSLKEVLFLRKKLVHAMIATKVAEQVYSKEKPDVFFMLHGIYSTWGPFRDYLRLKGVDTVIYVNTPARFGCFMFYRNVTPNDIVSKKSWDESKDSLSEEEEKQIYNYLSIRISGECGDQEIYRGNFNNKKNAILELLSKNKYSKRYVMYPNVAWDAVLEGQPSKIFNDLFSWIDKTIDFFKDKKDCQLIIKPHPAELAFEKCSRGVGDYIREGRGSLPENIIVLDPGVPLGAHDLIDSRTVAIVFNGSVGLELASRGIPVLAAADVHYKDAGAVYKVETLSDYLDLLGDPEKLFSFARDNIQLAKKYAHFYFFKSMVRIPFYKDDRWSTINWSDVGNIENLLNDNGNVIKICKRIINKEDIVAPL